MRKAAQQAGCYYARKRNRNLETVDDNTAPAWGTVVFGANVAQTVTINGTLIHIGGGAPDVALESTLAETVAALATYITDNLPAARASGQASSLMLLSRAPADTSVTLVASAATVSHSTLQKQRINARVAL